MARLACLSINLERLAEGLQERILILHVGSTVPFVHQRQPAASAGHHCLHLKSATQQNVASTATPAFHRVGQDWLLEHPGRQHHTETSRASSHNLFSETVPPSVTPDALPCMRPGNMHPTHQKPTPSHPHPPSSPRTYAEPPPPSSKSPLSPPPHLPPAPPSPSPAPPTHPPLFLQLLHPLENPPIHRPLRRQSAHLDPQIPRRLQAPRTRPAPPPVQARADGHRFGLCAGRVEPGGSESDAAWWKGRGRGCYPCYAA